MRDDEAIRSPNLNSSPRSRYCEERSDEATRNSTATSCSRHCEERSDEAIRFYYYYSSLSVLAASICVALSAGTQLASIHKTGNIIIV